MKLLCPILVILFFVNPKAQNPAPLDPSRALQDRANWFRQTPQFDRDSILFYFQKTFDILQTQQPRPHRRLTEVQANLAEYFYYMHDFNKALDYAVEAWQNFERIPTAQYDKYLEYNILNTKALALLEKGKNTEALKDYEKAYELLYNDPNLETQARINRDKGYFYNRFGVNTETQTTINTFLKGYKLFEQLNDTAKNAGLIVRICSNLADIYLIHNNPDSALYWQNKAEIFAKHYKNPYFNGWLDMMKGEIWLTKGDYTKAEACLKSSMKALERYKLDTSNYYQYDLFLLGKIAQDKKEFDKAIDYYKHSMTIANLINFRETVRDDLIKLSEVYELKGDKSTALYYYKQYFAEYSQILEARSQKSLKEKELQLDIANKEKEVGRYRITRNFSFVGVSLLSLLSLFIFLNYRNQKKLNATLRLLNEEKEFFIKEIHHRVKNNLQILSSLLHLQSRFIKDENALDAVREGQNRVEAMGLLHQKLYMGNNLASVDMPEYLKNLGDMLLDSLTDGAQISIHYAVQPLQLDIDTAIPLGLITNELVTNAIKYAFPEGRTGNVEIALWLNDNKRLCLKVADDGVGKQSDNADRQSTSFGTNLVHMLSKKLRGQPKSWSETRGFTTVIEFEHYKVV